MHKAEKIEVAGATATPLIDGCNFFTGAFTGGGFIRMSGGVSRREWEFFWRRHAGKEPPGPLPEGALAVLQAGGNGGAPTLMRPLDISTKDGVTAIAWRYTETAAPGEDGGALSYAILIVPGTELKETFESVSVAAQMESLTGGATASIPVLPAMKLRRKGPSTP